MIKKIFLILALFLASFSAANATKAANKINIDVNGLVCEFCAVTIEKNFHKKAEIAQVKVDLAAKKVFLEFKENKNLSDDKITEIIKNNGYNVVKINR